MAAAKQVQPSLKNTERAAKEGRKPRKTGVKVMQYTRSDLMI